MPVRFALLAALLGVSVLGATCNKSSAPAPKEEARVEAEEAEPSAAAGPVVQAPEITEVPGLDDSDLPGNARLEFWRLMNETFCYCGCPRTLAACLENRDDCSCVRCSEKMSTFILGLFREGASSEDVEYTLLEGFTEGYNGVQRSFDLTEHASLGPEQAEFTLVEFADFGCGHCRALAPVLDELLRQRSDTRLLYFYFPLGDAESPNQLAAEAAEEARIQGKFWPMAKKLFENPYAFDKETLVGAAKELGLDVKRFETALEQRTHKQKVLADKKKGQELGVESTPTVFVNGRRFGLPRSVENFVFRFEIEADRGGCK